MMDKIYDIIDNINNLDITKKLEVIKEEIRNDEVAKKLIKKFNNAKELYEKYNYKEDFIIAKKELMSNELIKAYIEIQNEFKLLGIYINNNIDKLLDNKMCKKN